MAHKLRLVLLECRRPENMVRVDVRHDDVFDRQWGRLPNGGAQTLAIDEAASRIDHGDRVTPDNEADVGYRIVVLFCCILIDTPPDVNARGDFVGDEGVWGGGADAAETGAGQQCLAAS